MTRYVPNETHGKVGKNQLKLFFHETEHIHIDLT